MVAPPDISSQDIIFEDISSQDKIYNDINLCNLLNFGHPLKNLISVQSSTIKSINENGAHQIDVEAHGGDAVDDVHGTPDEIHNIWGKMNQLLK